MMRALGALLAGALLVLAVAGGVQAETISPGSTGLTSVPSFELPNSTGALSLPAGWTVGPRSQEQLSYAQLQALWQGAGAAYGIPWQVLAAINKVESNFGRNMGPSSAGAIGWMQFMPSTWLRWGWDFDGDGNADPWQAKDGIYSAARYLAAAGGQSDVQRAVFAYNHAQWYVDEVLALARTFEADPAVTFEIDQLQVSLQDAQRKVARLSERLSAAEKDVAAAEAEQRRWLARADREQVMAEQSRLLGEAAQAGANAAAARQVVSGLEQKLQKARAELEAARQQSLTASFNPAIAPLLSAPKYSGQYVFPVGGGPGQVSVSHYHHDYPAADIAAPEGAPLYALINGTVNKAWDGIDPLCGIGFTLLGDDGQEWVYCHLSYREPAIQPGTRLSAGQPVGLVGHTGHATGPHLHLGLMPASYPQEQDWFQSFAGVAFTWQDATTPIAFSLQSEAPPAAKPAEFTVVEGDGSSDQSALASPAEMISLSETMRALRAQGGPRPIFGAITFLPAQPAQQQSDERSADSSAVITFVR